MIDFNFFPSLFGVYCYSVNIPSHILPKILKEFANTDF